MTFKGLLEEDSVVEHISPDFIVVDMVIFFFLEDIADGDMAFLRVPQLILKEMSFQFYFTSHKEIVEMAYDVILLMFY